MPIVNGLTDFNHPCQVLTDIFSILERIDPENIDSALRGKKIAFFGDTASNMSNSWIIAAAYIGFDLVLAGPEGYEPTQEVLEKLKAENLAPRHTFTNNHNPSCRTMLISSIQMFGFLWAMKRKPKREKSLSRFPGRTKLLSPKRTKISYFFIAYLHISEKKSLKLLLKDRIQLFTIKLKIDCTLKKRF